MKNSNKSFAKVAVSTMLIALGSQVNVANADALRGHINPTLGSEKLVAELDDYYWKLDSVKDARGNKLAEFTNVEEPAHLEFNNDYDTMTYTFNIGCNTYSAPVRFNANIMKPGMLRGTYMYCEGLDEVERKFSGLMDGKSKFSMLVDKNIKLLQRKEDGTLLVWTVDDSLRS